MKHSTQVTLDPWDNFVPSLCSRLVQHWRPLWDKLVFGKFAPSAQAWATMLGRHCVPMVNKMSQWNWTRLFQYCPNHGSTLSQGNYLVCPKVGFQAGTTLETALGQANKLYPVWSIIDLSPNYISQMIYLKKFITCNYLRSASG